MGNAQRGGYEFIGGPGAIARNGLVAMELDSDRKITRLSAVWDALKTDNATVVAITEPAVEP